MNYIPADHAPPMWEHQARELAMSAHLAERALWWEPRTGKSRTIVDTIAYQYEANVIDACAVVAWPSAVPRVWAEEQFPMYLPDRVPRIIVRWESRRWGNKDYSTELKELIEFRGLSILAVNCEALTQSRAFWGWFQKFADRRRFMFVADESAWSASPNSARSKRAEAMARHAVSRRILDGSPVAEAPFDVFAQCNLLHRGILGYTRVEAFRARYGDYELERDENGNPVIGDNGLPVKRMQRNRRTGADYPVLNGYRHLDELRAKLLAIGSRVLRSDCADLPPKLYEIRRFALSQKAQSVYNQIEAELRAEIEGEEITVRNALARDGRLAMIARGWWPEGEVGRLCLGCGGEGCEHCGGEGVLIRHTPRRLIDPADNPALAILRDELEARRGQPCIVWCLHHADAADVTEAACDSGIAAVRHDGTMPQRERAASRDAFQNDASVDTIVATQASAGLGVRLDRAEVMIYYSQSFSARLRGQSEDRAEGLTKRKGTAVVDLIATGTIDEHKAAVLTGKATTATALMDGSNV